MIHILNDVVRLYLFAFFILLFLSFCFMTLQNYILLKTKRTILYPLFIYKYTLFHSATTLA